MCECEARATACWKVACLKEGNASFRRLSLCMTLLQLVGRVVSNGEMAKTAKVCVTRLVLHARTQKVSWRTEPHAKYLSASK